MANECSFSALITGRTANVREFLKTMRQDWAYEVICEDEPELEDFAQDGIISEYVEGFCKWSVLCAMRDKFRSPSIESESRKLGLFVEIYSTEIGCAFQEHVFIKKGEIVVDDCVDYDEIYVGEYDSIEEYNAANGTDFTQDMVEDDFIIIGGFGEKYGRFHTITDFKSEEPDLYLEIADLVDHTPDLSRITVDTQIFDDFTRNTYITIQFEEMGNEIYLYKYKMLKKNNDGITMELIPEN